MTASERISIPRLLIAALRGSSAKTIVSLGIINAWRKRGIKVIPFKKGPDYIDAAWLTKAAEQKCRHLDLYLMEQNKVKNVFCSHNDPKAISIIEGNRGLYDGVDIHGTYSTAKIAKLLNIPVILIVDCSKSTNTVATFVLGCQKYDPDTPLQGVILNNVSGQRHGRIIKDSIEYHSGLPVVGIIPRIDLNMPERHLGLTTVDETTDFMEKLNMLGEVAEKHIDLSKLIEIAKNAPQISFSNQTESKKRSEDINIKIGIIKDSSFQFYYPENLEALEHEGAVIIEFDSMKDTEIKDVEMLYIAGGFPEVHAEKLSKNKIFRDSIKYHAEKGMPIYGECGAVIYLGKSVVYDNKKYEMCNVFPLDFELKKKPVGHGYTNVEVDKENPYFPIGSKFKGHEFHYSLATNWNEEKFKTAFTINKGYGFEGKRDGLFQKNVFATYTHLHATGAEHWAKHLIQLAKKVRYTN